MSFYMDTHAGIVKATVVLAVPRSVSSALTKALSVSPDFGLYIFQPFYHDQMSLHKLDAYIRKTKREEDASTENPLTIIMKVMAESVSKKRFSNLMPHLRSICTLVRDPQAQALSVFRAMYNRPSGKKFTQSERDELKKMKNHKTL